MKSLTINRGIAQDGKTLFFTDASDTYGTDLPERDTLALVSYITLLKADGTVIVVTPGAHSPIDVVTLSVDVQGKDGIYRALAWALPQYASGPLDEGTVVFNTSTNKINKQTADGLTVLAVTDLIDEDDLEYGEQYARIAVELTKYKNMLALIKQIKLKASLDHSCEEFEYIEARKNYELIVLALVASNLFFCSGEYLSAAQQIETNLAFGKKALNLA